MPLLGVKRFFRNFTVFALVIFAIPLSTSAQTHVVTREEMRSAIADVTQTRERHRERIVSFLSSPGAVEVPAAARPDVKLVTEAVSSLSDEELVRLSARVGQAESDFAAGRLSERDLLWILVGIAALILIIVAVD